MKTQPDECERDARITTIRVLRRQHSQYRDYLKRSGLRWDVFFDLLLDFAAGLAHRNTRNGNSA